MIRLKELTDMGFKRVSEDCYRLGNVKYVVNKMGGGTGYSYFFMRGCEVIKTISTIKELKSRFKI